MTSLLPVLLPCLLAASAVPLVQASERTGIKMTIHGQVFEGNPTEHTIYVQRDRKRMEFRNYAGPSTANGSQQRLAGPRLASITRCDLGSIFELNLDAGEYVSAPYPPKPKPLTQREIETHLKIRQSDKPTLRIEMTTVDTGERKEAFGFTARHVIITRKEIPLENSRRRPQETVTDGWYIDLDLHVSCEPWLRKGRPAHAYMATSVYSSKGSVTWEQPPERSEFVDIGEPETGFPVQSMIVSKVAYTLPDGTSKETTSRDETLVTELELGPLDPALFEIPPRFKHVDHIERNPRVSARSGQDLWDRFKAKLTSLLSLLDGSNTKPKY